MTTSRVPAAIDYLVTACRAAATLGQAVPPVTVLDGPVVTADPGPLALWVGCADIDPATSQPDAAASTQNWAALGRRARDEQLTIFCTAQAWSGDNDVRSMRVAVYAIASAVEDLVRADVTLGGAVTVPGNAAVTASGLRQGPTPRGMAARVTIEITAQARI